MWTRRLIRGAGQRSSLALAVAALIGFAQNAEADNVLRRGRGTSVASGGDAAARAAQAAAAAQQSQRSMGQALDAMRRARKAQDDARSAALGRPADVPNGLEGLVVAPKTSANTAPWQGASRPEAQIGADGRTSVTITQADPKAILSWTTFDVGKETDVYFNQTAGKENAASWIALNRVLDPLGAPSQILGSIRAEGQIYIINRNGVIFGGTSQVNVATLIASSLDIVGEDLTARNRRFMDGILATAPGAT